MADTNTDGDGLLDWVETDIGTDPASDDSDHDGLADRRDFGAVADGLPGEYVSGVPLVTDLLGNSLPSAPGMDVTGLYATGFKDEVGANWLYLTLRVTDEQYNPDAWYEIYLSTADNFYQYRFDEWDSYLWRQEDNEQIEISEGRIEGNFRDQLEVLIPLDLLANPVTATVGELHPPW